MSNSSRSRGQLPSPTGDDPGATPDTSAPPSQSLPLPNLYLTLKLKEAFAADPALKNAPIDITVSAGVVNLAGIVRTRFQEIIAISVAGAVKGVQAISNHIRIVPPQGKADSRREANRHEVSPG